MAENDAFAPSMRTLRTVDQLTKQLSASAAQFGRALTGALAQGIVEGKRLEDVLRGVGRSMTESLLKSALSPLQSEITKLISLGADSVLNHVRGGFGLSALGAAMGGGVRPFADGGIVASPTYFPLGRGLGLMGERGAEAIMPLSRGPDGRLGVSAGGGQGRALNVTVQVSTPDADSFRRSEAQVSAAIARAVARGSRAL